MLYSMLFKTVCYLRLGLIFLGGHKKYVFVFRLLLICDENGWAP